MGLPKYYQGCSIRVFPTIGAINHIVDTLDIEMGIIL
jgi:hypothetical protein